MRIELSEILACPACGPEQGLVLLVEESRGRRVLRGRLGCPECDARHPVSEGRVDLASAAPEGATRAYAAPASDQPDAPGDDELVVQVAALLDLRNRKRPVLLGFGLGRVAPRIAELAGDVEVMALEGSAEPRAGDGAACPENVTRVGVELGAGVGDEIGDEIGADVGATLPFLSRRLGGVALLRPGPDAVREGARLLANGGRLVGIRPSPDPRDLLSELGLDVLVSEERAFVASRGESSPA